ncbi:MAG TPA: SIS domain-containing protein [Arthrobacter sp.]|nr:SIS domain-containing protein [Arthrobacter sp.]
MTAQIGDHMVITRELAPLLPVVGHIADALKLAFSAGGTLYTFGNGGSAADAQHFTGELIGRYLRDRRPLPAVTLSTDPTAMTCIGNDFSFDDVFSRQVQALVRPEDVVVAFTTTGRSPNVVAALRTAKERGATTVLFGGGDGSLSLPYADHAVLSPSNVTARIQETHTLLMHLVSEELDRWAAATGGR